MVSISGGPILDEMEHKVNRDSSQHYNWWYSDKKQEQTSPVKNILPKQDSLDSKMDPDSAMFGDRRSSVTIVEDMVGPVQPPTLPSEPLQANLPPKRKESDIDRLYRLSNLVHGCGSRDD